MSIYTSQTISNYNTSPPPDDGSTGADNQVSWAKHKTKLADPIKTLAEAINTHLVAVFPRIMFGSAELSKSAGYTVTTSDRGKHIYCSAALTLALPSTASAGSDFVVIVSADGGDVTIDPNGSEEVEGATTYTLPDGGSAVLYCNGSAWRVLFYKALIDEDDMASDSALYAPTQQSVKAYVDAQASGGWVPLATQTVSVAAASVDFTSGIDGTYKRYAVVYNGVTPASDGAALRVRTGNGGSFDGGSGHYGYGYDGTTDNATFNSITASQTYIEIASGVGNAANEGADGCVFIEDPSNAAKYTKFTFSGSYNDNGSKVYSLTGGGQRAEAAAHDRIQFLFATGNVAAGTFTLYGLAGA